jgi:hypothetical protein
MNGNPISAATYQLLAAIAEELDGVLDTYTRRGKKGNVDGDEIARLVDRLRLIDAVASELQHNGRRLTAAYKAAATRCGVDINRVREAWGTKDRGR